MKFPEEMLTGDPENLSDHRAVIEWCWLNYTTPEDREVLRNRAEANAKILTDSGHDLDNPHVVEGLWVSWLCSSANWQQFIDTDCGDEGHMAWHSARALQWSGMILLLATDKTVPDPDTYTEETP
jgi:hypothetical protein